MNILYLTDVPLDSVGGAQESMKVVMEGLSYKYNFYMITPKMIKKKEFEFNVIENLKYDDFIIKGKSLVKILDIINYIKKQIIKNKIDIIHVQMPSTMILIGIMRKFNLIDKSMKILYTDRGVLNKYGKKTYYSIKFFEKFFYKIIVTTKNNADLYCNMLFIDNNKIKVINNTAGAIFENYDENIRINMRKKYNILPSESIIMMSGRMNKDKNWTLAKEIIEDMRSIENTKFIIALGSNGKEENILECKNFIKEVKQLLDNKLIISYIDVDLNTMSNLYYISDIFVLTSKVESFGRTAVEAMSRKNIVFGTKVDGLKEVIGFEENLYSEKREIISLLKKCICLDNKNEKKERFYGRFKEKFSLDNNLIEHIKLYDNLLLRNKND